MSNGLIHIYQGNGKGKTTAVLGLTMRCVGAGFKVLFCQFLKGQDTCELSVLKSLGVEVIRTDGVKKFVPYMNSEEKAMCIESHRLCYNRVKDKIKSGDYDLIVLDEVLGAVELSLIDVDDLVELVKSKPLQLEIAMTGRNADKKLIEIADYVSKIDAIKHPYTHGITARRGIEN